MHKTSLWDLHGPSFALILAWCEEKEQKSSVLRMCGEYTDRSGHTSSGDISFYLIPSHSVLSLLALLSIAQNSKAGTSIKSVKEHCDGLMLFTAELNGAVRLDLPRREHDSCHCAPQGRRAPRSSSYFPSLGLSPCMFGPSMVLSPSFSA